MFILYLVIPFIPSLHIENLQEFRVLSFDHSEKCSTYRESNINSLRFFASS